MTQKSNGKNLNNSTNLHRAYENEKDKNKQKIYHYPINLSSNRLSQLVLSTCPIAQIYIIHLQLKKKHMKENYKILSTKVL